MSDTNSVSSTDSTGSEWTFSNQYIGTSRPDSFRECKENMRNDTTNVTSADKLSSGGTRREKVTDKSTPAATLESRDIETAIPNDATLNSMTTTKEIIPRRKKLCRNIEIFLGSIILAFVFICIALYILIRKNDRVSALHSSLDLTHVRELPSAMPSTNPPTYNPTSYPSSKPSFVPSTTPTLAPSFVPSTTPTLAHSIFPTISTRPTTSPTVSPTEAPSNHPTDFPTHEPTSSPTDHPTNLPSSSPSNDFYEFFVMGDTPYDDDDAKKLVQQLRDVPNDAPFIYHLGDLNKATDTMCNETAYIKARNILLTANSPVFVTPGDNDWNDCPDPDAAWGHWTRHFMDFDLNWRHSLRVRRMSERKENISFFRDFVLFVGVNLVGGSRVSFQEHRARMNDNLAWTVGEIKSNLRKLTSVVIFGHTKPRGAHDNYFIPLSRIVGKLGIPVLYIHGDGHQYHVIEGAFGTSNMWDVEVDNGGRAPPMKVRVTKWLDKPFEFDRRK